MHRNFDGNFVKRTIATGTTTHARESLASISLLMSWPQREQSLILGVGILFLTEIPCHFLHLIQSMRPTPKHHKGDVFSTIDQLKDKLLGLNPAQLDFQLAAINRILKGTGTVIDIKPPTEAQKTRGRPKGALNKAKTT